VIRMIRIIVVCVAFLFLNTAYAAVNSPEGYWRTIDDVTGKARSIMKIWKTSNNVLYGKLATIYPDPGKDIYQVCNACKGYRHNQRVLGMTIMEGLTQSKDNPNEWDGGSILDPDTGKSYRILITVIDNGQKLQAHGYIGIHMFGRTQIWERVTSH